MKTAKQMADEMRSSTSKFVTYGNSDLGIPIQRELAIIDIEQMDDEMIGDGTWYECDENGNIIDADESIVLEYITKGDNGEEITTYGEVCINDIKEIENYTLPVHRSLWK